jgi:hypothetical protein
MTNAASITYLRRDDEGTLGRSLTELVSAFAGMTESVDRAFVVRHPGEGRGPGVAACAAQLKNYAAFSSDLLAVANATLFSVTVFQFVYSARPCNEFSQPMPDSL